MFILHSNYSHKIGLLKYNGGGDWYANPTALSNLTEFCNSEIGTNINPVYDEVEVGDNLIFNYPYIHLTGHGNVVFNSNEVSNLRNYLLAGGFLHISDNYGLDPFIRKEMKKFFQNLILLNQHLTIPYIIKVLILMKDCLKFINTIKNHLWDWD